jgi:hypothetical protein
LTDKAEKELNLAGKKEGEPTVNVAKAKHLKDEWKRKAN